MEKNNGKLPRGCVGSLKKPYPSLHTETQANSIAFGTILGEVARGGGCEAMGKDVFVADI